jgi:response regulator RpfG family c-di-GMP phosphodiesterase
MLEWIQEQPIYGVGMNLTDPTLLALNSYTKALSTALGYRDVSTRLHSDRVTGLSHAIGVGIGLSGSELGMLNVAASFHDVGKIGIPDAILLKPSAHNEAERIEMRRHTEIGEKIIAATEIEGAQEAASSRRHRLPRSVGWRGNPSVCENYQHCRQL